MKQTILAMCFLFVAATAHATSFRVSFDTSPLTGVQTLGFGLTNFDSSSNTLALSGFDFDSGSPVASSEDCTLGGTLSSAGCSGDLSAGVTLADLDPTAAFFTQQFNPGSSLSFVLNASNAFSGGGIPDQFSMYVCNGALTTCYSDDASGAMLLLDLSGGTLTPSSFTAFGATLQGVNIPVVSEIAQTQVPEPSTLLLLCGGLCALVQPIRKKHAN